MVNHTCGPITRAYESKDWNQLERALRENQKYLQQCGQPNLLRAIQKRESSAVKIFLRAGVIPPQLNREDQFWFDQVAPAGTKR